jgi:putative endonuclease
MVTPFQIFGKKNESIAADYLKRRGYHIIEQNYRTRLGEIDIIARDHDTIAFVEVKSRSTTAFGNPKYAVTPQKQKKISLLALQYLKSTRQSHVRARFDVVAILSNATCNAPTIELIKNAFALAG